MYLFGSALELLTGPCFTPVGVGFVTSFAWCSSPGVLDSGNVRIADELQRTRKVKAAVLNLQFLLFAVLAYKIAFAKIVCFKVEKELVSTRYCHFGDALLKF